MSNAESHDRLGGRSGLGGLPIGGLLLSRVSHVRDADGERRRFRRGEGVPRRRFWAEVERATPRRWAVAVRVAYVTALGCVSLMVLQFVVLVGFGEWILWGFVAFAVEFVALGVISLAQFVYGPDAVLAASLRLGRCAACGYDISRTEAKGDGCVVCPECGVPWNVVPRRCTRCEYDLKQLPADEFGVVRCPECGAARRVDE